MRIAVEMLGSNGEARDERRFRGVPAVDLGRASHVEEHSIDEELRPDLFRLTTTHATHRGQRDRRRRIEPFERSDRDVRHDPRLSVRSVNGRARDLEVI
jgi:hypothetical protein